MGSVLRVSRQRPPGDRGLSCRGATGARAGGWVGVKLMDTLKGCKEIRREWSWGGVSDVGEDWGRNQQKESCIIEITNSE